MDFNFYASYQLWQQEYEEQKDKIFAIYFKNIQCDQKITFSFSNRKGLGFCT